MRKSFMVSVTVGLVLLLMAQVALAAEVAITSVGQSPDGMMVKVLLKKLKMDADYDSMMKPTALKDHKVLIAVIGGSSKGLGAAGIDKNQEKDRAMALVNAAKKAKMKVLVMHVGGEGRRGALTDMFVEAVNPHGDRVIVVKGGNIDGLFTKTKGKNAKLIEVKDIQAAATPVEEALKEWGVKR